MKKTTINVESVKSNEPLPEPVWVNIADIKVGNRVRRNFARVRSLAEDIKAKGLQYPVRITTDNRLVDGETRIRAFKLLGLDAIPAIIKDVANILEYEISLNVERGSFDYFETVIGVDRLVEEYRRAVGRPKKDADAGVDAFGLTFENTEALTDWAAKKLGLSGKSEYQRRKKVSEDAIKDVQTAVSEGIISSSYAYKLCLLPKNQQLTTLRKATTVPDVDAKELNAFFKEQGAVNRVSKLGGDVDNPDDPTETPNAENYYNLVAITPNFPKDKVEDLSKLPIHRHAGKDSLICVICKDSMIDRGGELIRAWGLVHWLSVRLECLEPENIVGLTRKKAEPVHILLCGTTKNISAVFGESTIASTVYCSKPRMSAMEVIESAFKNSACGYMLDMTAKVAHGTWSVLNTDV